MVRGRDARVVALMWFVLAGCGGAQLSPTSSGHPGHPPPADAGSSRGTSPSDGRAAAAGDAATGDPVTGDAGQMSAGRADAGSRPDAPVWAPYPPATCSNAGWSAPIPGHATVGRCPGQLALSSTLTSASAAAPFSRCGVLGPEVETDLRLSPDHALYIGEVLIPVKHLINGSTIVQVPCDEVTYYHVELPKHSVLLAEGLAAESYLDGGDPHTWGADLVLDSPAQLASLLPRVAA